MSAHNNYSDQQGRHFEMAANGENTTFQPLDIPEGIAELEATAVTRGENEVGSLGFGMIRLT